MYQREIKKKQGSKVLEKWTEERTLIHSNFGWGGLADGYYASGTFNLKMELMKPTTKISMVPVQLTVTSSGDFA